MMISNISVNQKINYFSCFRDKKSKQCWNRNFTYFWKTDFWGRKFFSLDDHFSQRSSFSQIDYFSYSCDNKSKRWNHVFFRFSKERCLISNTFQKNQSSKIMFSSIFEKQILILKISKTENQLFDDDFLQKILFLLINDCSCCIVK